MLNNAMEIVLCIKKIHYVIVQKKKLFEYSIRRETYTFERNFL